MRRTLLALLVALPGVATAADAPALAGRWTLDRAMSQNLSDKIKDAAGSAQMSGGPSWATETWFRWGTSFSENQRISVRDFLLATVPAFDAIEIEQGPDEVKTTHGEAGSRTFHVTRASSGTSALSGETVKRTARLDGGKLLLESKGKEGVLRESFSLEQDRLVYMVHLEQKLFKAPLDARLVYDRVP